MISVVIPTYHRPELLTVCLDRLAPGHQTLSNDRYEVIVTDDGETTVKALVEQQYPWVTWVAGPRRGPAANRNNGVRYARGEWLVFTDDDCAPSTEWLASFATAIHPGCDVYEGKTTCEIGIRSPLEISPVNLTGGYLWSCNFMVRKNVFEMIGGFDEKFPAPHMEDVDFHERLKAAGKRIDFLPLAAVDHPPRRLPGGRALARHHSSFIYYWYKSGRRGFCSPKVLYDILRFRMQSIRRYPLGWDSALALVQLLVEIVFATPRVIASELRYRHSFPKSLPTRVVP